MEPSIGSLDNPNSGLVFWRVAEGEVASTTDVTITVEVSDGFSEVRESVVVTVLAEGATSQEPPAPEPEPQLEEPPVEEPPAEEPTEVAVDPLDPPAGEVGEPAVPEEEVVIEPLKEPVVVDPSVPDGAPEEEVVVDKDESVVQIEDILEDPGELEVSTL